MGRTEVVVEEVPALDEQVAAYYAEPREHQRLTGGGRLELLRTLELLDRYLPPAPAAVLDVGGGAGVYALPLARKGYTVELVDPVALHVEQARAASSAEPSARLLRATVGDARSLPHDDDAFDAVLLLGPLYHLVTRADRLTALAEAARVLRPGGVLVAAVISRFASTYDGLYRRHLDEPGFETMVEDALHDGVHRNPTGRPGWFTTAYFHRPEEIAGEVTAAGLAFEALVAVEGPASFLPDLEARLEDPVRRARLLTAIRRVEAEPSLLGASAHLLAVGRTPLDSAAVT